MKRHNIVVELTPLLDVVLVILFLVLVQSQGRVDTAYQDVQETLAVYRAEYAAAFETEVQALVADFGEEMDMLRQRSDDFDALQMGLEENTAVVLVTLESESGNRANRHLIVETESVAESIPLTWDGFVRNEATLRLNTLLAQAMAEGDVTFIVFRFDSANTFEEDYILVRMAIRNQQLHSPRVFSVVLDM